MKRNSEEVVFARSLARSLANERERELDATRRADEEGKRREAARLYSSRIIRGRTRPRRAVSSSVCLSVCLSVRPSVRSSASGTRCHAGNYSTVAAVLCRVALTLVVCARASL